MNSAEENKTNKQLSSSDTNSSFSKKKMNWEVSERRGRFAILKHWATLTTLGLGILTMVGMTTLFYRENKGAAYKGKFQTPIALSPTTWVKPEAETQQTNYWSYQQTGSHSLLPCTIDLTSPEKSPVSIDAIAPKVVLVETPEAENIELEELKNMNGLAWHILPNQTSSGASFQPQNHSDYFSGKSKASLWGRFQIGFEAGVGKNFLLVSDARNYDSQVVSDVKTNSSLCTTFGGNLDVRVLKHWSVSSGYYQSSYTSDIIPHFFADTTGTGCHWPPPGGEEEHEEHEEHGQGENVIQMAIGGYDVVTNAGVTHVQHDADEDFNILSGSKEYFTYVSIPLNVNYHLSLRKFDFQIGAGANYHHLKEAYALLNVEDDRHFAIQKSAIVGLKSHYFTQALQLGVQYKLTYRLSVGASFKMNYALTNMNAATPFNTKVNGFAGMGGVYYNF